MAVEGLRWSPNNTVFFSVFLFPPRSDLSTEELFFKLTFICYSCLFFFFLFPGFYNISTKCIKNCFGPRSAVCKLLLPILLPVKLSK